MERAAFLLQVKKGRQEQYLRAHEPGVIWPSIVEVCRMAGMKNYSGWIGGRDDCQVFAYFESESVSSSLEALAESADNANWQSHMSPLMEKSVSTGNEGVALLRPAFFLP